MMLLRKNKFLIFSLFVIIIGVIFLFQFFVVKNFILAEDEIQNNFGGWSWSSNFGWNSENCNNRYFASYEDHCGINNETMILDIDFDGSDVNLLNSKIKDNSRLDNSLEFINLTLDNIKNKDKSNFDKSVEFMSSNNYILLPDYLFLPNAVTINFWLKSDVKSQNEGIFFIASEGILAEGEDHTFLSWRIGSNEIIIEEEFFRWDNNWHYYTIVRDGVNVKAYRDAEYVGEANFIQRPDGENLSKIGQANCASCGGILNFNGQMDEIRIYTSVLSVDQIRHNMLYNSNYYLDINNNTGEIMGWIWSSGLGWICFGTTCSNYGLPPRGSLSDTILHWSPDQGNNIYPHMITGWAKAITFDESYQESFRNTGWISLQGLETFIIDNKYKDCVSCSVRDEDNNLVAYWKFDEDIGEIASDSSGNNNNGLLIGFGDDSWNNSCKVNNCLHFNTGTNSVNTPMIPLSSRFTISWWSKQNIKRQNGMFYFTSNGDMGGIYGTEEGSFVWGIKDSDKIIIPDKFFMFDNNWHYYVVIKNDASVKIYRDGEFFSESFFSDGSVTLNLEAIGYTKSRDGTDLYFDGYMDHIKLYNNRLLTDEEVRHSYNYPEKRFCSACFNELDAGQNNICYQCSMCDAITEIKDTNTCEECASCRKYGLVFDSNTANIKGYAWGGFKIGSELFGVGWIKFSPNFAAGLYRSYVATKYGDIYSKSNIGSDYTIIPPLGYFNSSYMIQANGHIVNWVSEKIAKTTPEGSLFYDYNISEPWMNYYNNPQGFISTTYEYPKQQNDFGNILGSLDYEGLKNGIYGTVINDLPNSGVEDYNVCLNGKIYALHSGDYILEEKAGSGISYLFNNCNNGSGVIIIDGDLTIKGNVEYREDNIETNYKNLASVAWIIKGDLYIDGEVSKLAGTFIVLGDDSVPECGSDLIHPIEKCGIIYTGDSPLQLEVSGQILAKNFQFQRTFRNTFRDPAELIIYDGRNIINPPPGLGDVIKSLPRWDQISPYKINN